MLKIDAGCSDAPSTDTCATPGNPAWHFTVVTSAFTLASVFAPATLGRAGWFWGTVMWIYSYATTWWSGVLIGKCVLHGASRGVGCSYPEMVGDAFGAAGYCFTAAMQIVTYYLVNVSLLVNVANWSLLVQEVLVVRGAVEPGALCLWHYLLIGGCLAAALAQIRTFKRVLPAAIVSLLSTCVCQGILYYQIASMDLVSECEPTFGGVTSNSMVISLATTAYLFGGHGLFPDAMREMRRPESFFAALHASYVIIGLIYATCAYTAYAVWGEWVNADVQFNWPLNGATLVSAALNAVVAMVQMTISNVMILSHIEAHLEPWGMVAGSTRYAAVKRVALRIGVVGSEVFLALMFSSAGIGNLQGFVGAFGFTALTYYAPFALYWKLVLRPRGASWLVQACFGAVFLSGILLTVAGVYAALDGVAGDIAKYRLFDTTRCSASDLVEVDSCSNPCLAAYGFDGSHCNLP